MIDSLIVFIFWRLELRVGDIVIELRLLGFI